MEPEKNLKKLTLTVWIPPLSDGWIRMTSDVIEGLKESPYLYQMEAYSKVQDPYFYSWEIHDQPSVIKDLENGIRKQFTNGEYQKMLLKLK